MYFFIEELNFLQHKLIFHLHRHFFLYYWALFSISLKIHFFINFKYRHKPFTWLLTLIVYFLMHWERYAKKNISHIIAKSLSVITFWILKYSTWTVNHKKNSSWCHHDIISWNCGGWFFLLRITWVKTVLCTMISDFLWIFLFMLQL